MLTGFVPGAKTSIVPLDKPVGACFQSALTHTLSSVVTFPRVALKTIHGSLAFASNVNGSRPRLNTSIKRRDLLNTSNVGNDAGSLLPGQAAVEPSMATPNEAWRASSISCTTGMLLTGGCCQPV